LKGLYVREDLWETVFILGFGTSQLDGPGPIGSLGLNSIKGLENVEV
jgi:hypothetical protein